MRGKWLIAASVVAALAVGVALASHMGGESAEHRVRRHFDVPGTLDTVSLRAAVLRQLPIGSPEARLTDFVAVARIGADEASSYFPIESDGSAAIRIDETPAPLDPVVESYIIAFQFDGARRLRDVRVHRILTGP